MGRYRELKWKERIARTWAAASELPPEDRLTKSQLRILRFFAEYPGEPFSPEDVQDQLRLRSKPASVITELGVTRSLLTETGDRTDHWIINEAGLSRVAQYDELDVYKSHQSQFKREASHQFLVEVAENNAEEARAEQAHRASVYRARRLRGVVVAVLILMAVAFIVWMAMGSTP